MVSFLMKKLLLSAAAGIAVLSTVNVHAQAPVPPPVQSQTGEPTKADKPGKGDKAAKGKERLDKLKTDLALTDDQAKKVQDVMMEQREKMKGMKDDTALTKEQKMENMKAGRAEVDAKISALLTPEQKAKWDAMKKDRPAKPEKPAAQ